MSWIIIALVSIGSFTSGGDSGGGGQNEHFEKPVSISRGGDMGGGGMREIRCKIGGLVNPR